MDACNENDWKIEHLMNYFEGTLLSPIGRFHSSLTYLNDIQVQTNFDRCVTGDVIGQPKKDVVGVGLTSQSEQGSQNRQSQENQTTRSSLGTKPVFKKLSM